MFSAPLVVGVKPPSALQVPVQPRAPTAQMALATAGTLLRRASQSQDDNLKDIPETIDPFQDELKKTANSADVPARCLWGSYFPAKLKAVQQGMYQVKFDDGAVRWATCGELTLPDAPVMLTHCKHSSPMCVHVLALLLI